MVWLSRDREAGEPREASDFGSTATDGDLMRGLVFLPAVVQS